MIVLDVLIVYERKQRELENAILLQIELESRGYSCDVVQFYEASNFNLLNINSPKVILTPHLYNTKSVYRNLARFGHADFLINLQYEQVLSKKWEELGAHTPKGLAQKFYHICWGDEVVKRLKEGGVPNENIKVFAPLHLDLLRKEYRPPQKQIKELLSDEFNIDSTKKWTLFLSSFTYADIELTRLKVNEAAAGTDLSDFPIIHTESRNELIEWFSRVLDKDKENILIYRPHPDELSLDKIERLEQIYPNFRVIRDKAVKEWIAASDVLYTWYSTSVVEAHFLEKPYSILRPFPLPETFDSVLLRHGKYIETYDNFETDFFLSDELRTFAIDDVYIRRYYQVNAEAPTYKIFANFIEDLMVISKADVDFSYDVKEYLVAKLKALTVYPIYGLNKMFGRLLLNGIFSTNGLLSLLNKEMINQIATKREKDKLKAMLKATIGQEGE